MVSCNTTSLGRATSPPRRRYHGSPRATLVMTSFRISRAAVLSYQQLQTTMSGAHTPMTRMRSKEWRSNATTPRPNGVFSTGCRASTKSMQLKFALLRAKQDLRNHMPGCFVLDVDHTVLRRSLLIALLLSFLITHVLVIFPVTCTVFSSS